MKEFRIIFLANNLENSGPIRGLFAIRNGLIKYQKKNTNISTFFIFLGKKPHKKEKFIDYKYLDANYLNYQSIFDLPNVLFKYFVLLFKIKPNIVFSTGFKSDIINSLSFNKFKKLTIVRASSYADSIKNKVSNKLKRIILFKIFYLVASFKDYVVYFTKNMLLSDLKNYARYPKRFVNIQNFIDEEQMGKLYNEKLPKRLNFITKNDSDNVFLTIGSLTNRKNISTIIESIGNLNRIGLNTKILIVGDGPLKKDLQKLVLQLNISKNIFFLGTIDNPLPIFKYVDAFVMASNHEGMPRSAIESIYFNVPVIIPKLQGFEELVTTENGIIYKDDLFKALQLFIENKSLFNNVRLPEIFRQKMCIDKFFNLILDHNNS